jgi:hypothetical protein
LYDRVGEVPRVRHYSRRTEEAVQRLGGAAAIALYVASFLLPASDEPGAGILPGHELFIGGLLALLGGLPVWLGNPAFWLGLILLWRRSYKWASATALVGLVPAAAILVPESSLSLSAAAAAELGSLG